MFFSKGILQATCWWLFSMTFKRIQFNPEKPYQESLPTSSKATKHTYQDLER